MIIYKITNTINNRVYIGQTVGSLAKRWTQHTTSKKNSPMYNAFRKHGRENFKIEAICTALDPQYLNDLEQYFIKLYDSLTPKGYNLTSGGDSGFSRSQETKDKQRQAMLGHTVSQQTRDKIAKTLTGRPGVRKGMTHTEETKRLISQIQIGKKASEETKSKMSASHSGDKAYNARKVECIETGVIYPTATEAAKQLNLIQSSISAVCRGTRKSTGGLKFRFIE